MNLIYVYRAFLLGVIPRLYQEAYLLHILFDMYVLVADSNHITLVAFVTPADQPKSLRTLCVIKPFDDILRYLMPL